MAENDFDLRKITSPVLLHLLRKQRAHPRLFLWREPGLVSRAGWPGCP
jgi:hypothetical protein